MKHVPVLIAGGGPVGMTLARTLASFGVRCMLVERNASTTRHPKMDITNGRSMELFRRLGLADKLRAVGGAGGEQFRHLVDHVARRRPRAASLPLSQRRREARRDPGAERRHPAARAGHAGEPGDDRAGAARRHPRPSAGRGALGRGVRGFRPGRRPASPATLRTVETGATETVRCDFLAGCDGGSEHRARAARHRPRGQGRRSRTAT